MNNIPKPRRPKPRYAGTVVCSKCHAEYKPSADWYRGRYANDTTGRFVAESRVPDGCCPICLTPQDDGQGDG